MSTVYYSTVYHLESNFEGKSYRLRIGVYIHEGHITMIDTVPISSLSGIREEQKRKLKKIGLHTIRDLLLHLPIRYEDRTHFHKIGDLLPGTCVSVEGKILNCKTILSRRKMLICQIGDGSGILTMYFFNFSVSMKNIFSLGCHILAYGEVKIGKYGTEMIHPEYQICRSKADDLECKNTLTPIYPTINGVNQVTLRKFTKKALDVLDTYVVSELLPPELMKNTMSLSEALHILHYPPTSLQLSDLQSRYHPAKRRLIFEELLAYYLSMLLRTGSQRSAQPLTAHDNLKKQLLALLPFKLTVAQVRTIAEIERDMELNVSMTRLVQGDVGSGKTLVAAFTALRAIAHGKQVALMTPTELLAEQHASNFRSWFSPLGIRVSQLVGKQKGKGRLAQQDAIASGQVQMIIGTHAIFQKQVKFNDLALIIIDEQHRFGVHQRFLLWEKGLKQGYYPHKLIMTATPIPRTLAMTTCANFNTSIIDELPPGRVPISTVAISNTRRKDIINRVGNVCINEGRQAYWVCTLIEESDLLEAHAAIEIWKELKIALPNLHIGLLHGRMKNSEKKEIIKRFERGDLHLLVTTTIIEVGIDVSNASLMIVENPERLGLSQLHQLRGRIGRGSVISYFVLLYKSPLSKTAQNRLQVLRDSNNGFVIAQKDLEIRGPGELLGTRQTGDSEFKIANFLLDQEVIPEIEKMSRYIYEFYPKQALALIDRWFPEIRSYFNI